MLFKDYCEHWLSTDLSKAPTTKARDTVVLRTHVLPTLGKLTLAEIRAQDVQDIIQMMAATLSSKTVVAGNNGEDECRSPWSRPQLRGTGGQAVFVPVSDRKSVV